MTILPLEQIRFGWQSHISAMWWLFLLYRRPKHFRATLAKLPRYRQLLAGSACYVHALPWVLLAAALCKEGLFESGLVAPEPPGTSLGEQLSDLAVRVAVLLAVGIAGGTFASPPGGIAGGISVGLFIGTVGGAASGIAVGTAGRIVSEIATGSFIGLFISILTGIDDGSARPITLRTRNEIVFAISIVVGIAFGSVLWLAAGLVLLRVYYYPLVDWMVWAKPRGRWYRWHPVAWDERCPLPFPRLHKLLVAYFDLEPAAARREIERLIDSYPSQRWQALQAKAAVVARDAGRVADLSQLPSILASLPEGQDGFLSQVPELKNLIVPIAERQQQLDRTAYPTIRKQLAELLVHQIESFRDHIAGFEEPLQSEFRNAAHRWLDLVRSHLAEALSTPGDAKAQLFRAGDPVDREQEAFVYRTAIVAELEQQVLLASGCPGVILYGRRRMGKSTVLRNLTGFLPSSVPVGYVSMQNPLAFTSMGVFCQAAIDAARAARAWAPLPPGVAADLPGLMTLLAWANDQLGRARERLVLAIDEFEMIDTKIGEGVFNADLLATLRESIQSHRNITWIFAGSHEIAELRNAEWSSYLVSARTVLVPPFTPAETRELLTDPVRHSGLWQDKTKRPRFAAEFWGENGIERIHADAGGWPHLVQLLAETAVDVVNAEGATVVSDEMYQRVREKAIVRGDTVLRQLLEKECRLPGEWEYVSRFRRAETQPPPADEAIDRSLRRRLLVEAVNGDWRLRIPLMALWLRERA